MTIKFTSRETMKYTLALFMTLFSIHMNAKSIEINKLPVIGRLPVTAIHRLFQDSEGYIWYGTVNGLCRDDGYHIQVFRSDIYQSQTLANNLIQCITEDKKGNIWFGTDNGAYILDKKNYTIHPLDTIRLKNKQILSSHVTTDGYIWIGIHGCLLKYQSDGSLAKSYPIRNGTKSSYASGFCENRQGIVVITYSNGLIYFLNKASDSFEPYPTGLKRNNASVIIQDNVQDYYWLGTWGDGIVRFDPSASRDSMYIYQPMPINSMGRADGTILYLVQDDKKSHVWATTSCDLVAFSVNMNKHLQQLDLSHLLPSANRMLNEIIKDSSGNLWVSAFDQPSFIVHFIEDAPKTYPLPSIRKRYGYEPAIMGLSDDDSGYIWISQERTGVMLYDLNTDRMVSYTDCKETRLLPLHSVREMATSRATNGVWVTPLHSLQAYCLTHEKMNMRVNKHVDLSMQVGAGSHIVKLYEDSKRNLWLGTSKGLYHYSFEHKMCTAKSDTLGMVSGIIEASNGDIWICTNNKGVYQLSPKGTMRNYPSREFLSSIAITTDGMVWMGSEKGGIYTLNPHTGQWKDYSSICGMNGDQVNQIASDIFNHIWIDTNQKLIEFNPRNGSYRTYLTADGSMPLWRLLPTSLCKGLDGNIYIGGIPSITSVTPSNRLDSEARHVKTLITNIQVAGRSLRFGGQQEANSLHNIELQPTDRNLEISFSSLNHLYASKIRYAYRLQGIDVTWTYLQNGSNSAFYNYLPKGYYRFEVKATDENGLWSNKVTTLHIHRLPAFYETWWAITSYTLAGIGTLVWMIFLNQRRIKRKNKEMYADSKEMMKMHHYLNGKKEMEAHISNIEFAQLDELLLQKVVKTIEENLSEPDFDVSMLAEHANMSRSTLTRKLKAITGHTPLELIRQVKMKHASKLLKDKNKNISEVAMTLGYSNRKYFTSCFKEEFGITPSEYQKSIE